MTTLRDLPNGHYVLAALDDITCAAVPHGDPLAPLARRWMSGHRDPGAQEALQAWLAANPQYEVTQLPAPADTPSLAPRGGQPGPWEQAA